MTKNPNPGFLIFPLCVCLCVCGGGGGGGVRGGDVRSRSGVGRGVAAIIFMYDSLY